MAKNTILKYSELTSVKSCETGAKTMEHDEVSKADVLLVLSKCRNTKITLYFGPLIDR